MNKEFNFLYQYLEKEELFIDKTEFELQIQAHPDYPSLLSITDTLSFFNIENGAIQVNLSEIDLLPDCFIAILEEEIKEEQFYFIEKNEENYTYYNGKNIIKISKTELESRWNGIVILIENPEIEEEIKPKKNNLNLIWFIIILVVIVEISYFTFLDTDLKKLSSQLLIIFGFVFLLGIIAWNVLKKMLVELKELREFQLKGNKFIRNYEVFKNNLLASTVIENNLLQSSTIQLGNRDAPLKIIMIISPFSSYCRENHSIVEEILRKYSDIVCFDIRFNFNNNDYSEKKSKKVHQHLVAMYHDMGQEVFIQGLRNWFKDKDEKKLYIAQISPSNELKINEILRAQFNSNLENNLIFTPAIVINKYVFPKQYDRKDLIYFISELSEDQCFQ